MSSPSKPSVTVNGDEVLLDGIAAHTTTLDWLRGRGLTGAKEGCAEGECGACSVLVARPATDPAAGAPTEWTAINACLVPVAALDGQEVVTSEGLGTSSALHPVQQELAVRGGSQCGYCTPGFVCSLAAEFYRPGRTADGSCDHEHGPNGVDLHALSGNLCRCTGYRPIRDAAFALGSPDADDTLAARQGDPPPAPRPTRLAVDGAEFVRPATLAEALDLLVERPDAQVLAGSTDWGVEVNIRGVRAPLVVAVDRLAELRELSFASAHVEIGAALTLTEIERRLGGRVPLLAEMFPQFASRLIRNGATIGGNIATASPIGDTPPAPLADYFTGYRQTVRTDDELIRAIRLPLPLAPVVAFHKIAKRRFDDISSVAVGYALEIADGAVVRARIGLGGVAATPLRAVAAEDALVGRAWTEDTVRRAAAVLAGEGTPMDDHRASAAYRSAMLGQSLLRLFHSHADREEVSA